MRKKEKTEEKRLYTITINVKLCLCMRHIHKEIRRNDKELSCKVAYDLFGQRSRLHVKGMSLFRENQMTTAIYTHAQMRLDEDKGLNRYTFVLILCSLEQGVIIRWRCWEHD